MSTPTLDRLPNLAAGRWQTAGGEGLPLVDPVTGAALVEVGNDGLDLAEAYRFAREQGGAALRALSYAQRAQLLQQIAEVLSANRPAYEAIATANSGTVKADSAVDIDGAIYTLGQYARWGRALGEAHHLQDGAAASLAKDGVFQVQHILQPTRGLVLCINAFNFPSWGLWEKAAPALLAGVPVVAKPATATAWLTQRMVADVEAAGILPPGALSVICGRSTGLLDALEVSDLLSFTGSADTASLLRRHPQVLRHSIRTNIEADSLNAALLLPEASAGSEAVALFVREVAREMTVKSGQKCTAIRRAFVPAARYDEVAEALRTQLAKVVTGNPRHESVRMGALVSREQHRHVLAGIDGLLAEAELLRDGRQDALVDADPAVAACLGPTLLGCRQPEAATRLHHEEVFGPVATLMPYTDLDQAHALVRRGQGSLACSLYGEDPTALAHSALALGDLHGRVHIVTPEVARTHSGHGNVMPHALHGGPGRAGGGEELGGLRALGFYHRRTAIQASPAVLAALGPGAPWPA